MKAFEYLRPSSLREACQLLARADGEAKALAGGTDLLVQMKQGKLRPKVLVSLMKVPGLSFARVEDNGSLVLGGATPLGAMENSPDVLRHFPAVADAASRVGSVQVRNRATLGGNLCNAAPSADLAPILMAHGATATITDGMNERAVSLERFFTGPGQTVLQTGELLVAVTVPRAPARSFGIYIKSQRSAMDIATVGVGVFVVFGLLHGIVRVEDARIALGAVAPKPIRAFEAESALIGKTLGEDTIAAVSARAAQEARPISDVRASAEYRRTMVEVLSKRALLAAYSWVAGGERQ